MSDKVLIPVERIERTILRLRGHNVMLDADLARLYGVTTKRFNEQVKRNRRRFPADFMFQLTQEEYAGLRSHIATSSAAGHRGRRYLPYVFTEHGAVMAANVLNSPRAVQMSILVVRAFVRLRQLLQSNAESREQARCARAEVRRAVRGRVSRDQSTHDAIADVDEADRIPTREIVTMDPVAARLSGTIERPLRDANLLVRRSPRGGEIVGRSPGEGGKELGYGG